VVGVERAQVARLCESRAAVRGGVGGGGRGNDSGRGRGAGCPAIGPRWPRLPPRRHNARPAHRHRTVVGLRFLSSRRLHGYCTSSAREHNLRRTHEPSDYATQSHDVNDHNNNNIINKLYSPLYALKVLPLLSA